MNCSNCTKCIKKVDNEVRDFTIYSLFIHVFSNRNFLFNTYTALANKNFKGLKYSESVGQTFYCIT